MFSAFITTFCLMYAAIVCFATYNLRPRWFGCLVYVVFGSYAVLIILRHASVQFGMQAEWWLVGVTILVLMPVQYAIAPTVYDWLDNLRSRKARRSTVEANINSYLDSLLPEEER